MKKFNNKPNIIGNLIKKSREKKGFSKVDLSRELELLGVAISPKELYRIETNKMIVKDFELVACCIILDINFNDLKELFEGL